MRLPPGHAAGSAAGSGDQRVPRLHAAVHARRAARVAPDWIHRIRISGMIPITNICSGACSMYEPKHWIPPTNIPPMFRRSGNAALDVCSCGIPHGAR